MRARLTVVQPSCPAFVIHDDDAFRKRLISALDTTHFTVTISADGDGANEILANRDFNVIILGVNLGSGSGTKTLTFLGENRERIGCGIVILGDPDPRIRTFAPWVDETLLKPVDAAYVAQRARSYCGC